MVILGKCQFQLQVTILQLNSFHFRDAVTRNKDNFLITSWIHVGAVGGGNCGGLFCGSDDYFVVMEYYFATVKDYIVDWENYFAADGRRNWLEGNQFVEHQQWYQAFILRNFQPTNYVA